MLTKQLRQLEQAGKLDDCAGILIGTWIQCAEEHPESERADILDKKVSEILTPHGKPILSNIRSGHNVPMLTFPEGIEVEMDTREKSIICTESATVSKEISNNIY